MQYLITTSIITNPGLRVREDEAVAHLSIHFGGVQSEGGAVDGCCII